MISGTYWVTLIQVFIIHSCSKDEILQMYNIYTLVCTWIISIILIHDLCILGLIVVRLVYT